MRITSAICFLVSFMWIGVAALYPQSAEKPPAPKPGAAAQTGAVRTPATRPPTRLAPAVKSPAKAASESASKEGSPNSELEKLKADQEATRKAIEVAREWFRRLNALDGSKESLDRFMELFQADALQISGPRGDDQIGTSFFQGRDMIRKFAEKTAKDYSRIAYFIRQRTVNNKTADLLVANIGPWGDVSLALEFSGSVNIKESGNDQSRNAKDSARVQQRNNNPGRAGATEASPGLDSSKEKRFTVPGAAFFDIKDGKINRIRIIYAAGEAFPVGGTWILTL